MQTWFRLYNEIIDDQKVQRMSNILFKFWVNCLALASKSDGVIESPAAIAFALRMSVTKATKHLAALVELKLIDITDSGNYKPHNWDNRQFKSDTSTERVKRFRNVSRNGSSAVTATGPDQNRTEQNRAEPHSATFPERDLYGDYRVVAVLKTWCTGDEDFEIDEYDVAKWRHQHPSVDIKTELRRIREYLYTHPDKRVSEEGTLEFCQRWFSRVENTVRR